MTLPRYLICTDLSRASRRAIVAAAEFASAGRAKFDLVCVVPPPPRGAPGDVKAAVQTSLDRLAQPYADAGFETETHVLAAKKPAAALIRYATKSGADFIVAAPKGVTNWKKVAMGSVSERLLKRAPTSLLIARRPVDAPTRIVVGVDRSPGAAAALKAAGRLAKSLRAPIDAVEVIAAPNMAIHVEEAFVGVSSHEIIRERQRLTRIALKEWLAARSLPKGVKVKGHVVVGSAPQTLASQATELGATLLVVGAQAAAKSKPMFVGSVSRAVASSASMSVLVVRHRSKRK